jgi:hypothetical protein
MKNSTKLILATCGFIGSISLSHSQNIEYLEDDELYTQTSTALESGWAWGQSSNLSITREAFGSDNSGSDDSGSDEDATNF